MRIHHEGHKSDHSARHGKLLIVDADWLTRWSVQSYLSNRFDVRQAHSLEDAMAVLQSERFDAIVVSEDLLGVGVKVDEVESLARAANADVRIIWTVADTTAKGISKVESVRLEKPFDLSRLAVLLESEGYESQE